MDERERILKKLKEDELLTLIERIRGWGLYLWEERRQKIKRYALIAVAILVIGIVYTKSYKKANAEALRGLEAVELFYRHGSFDSAKVEAKQLIKKYGRSKWAGMAMHYVGNCEFHLGEYDAAIQAYKEALKKRLPKVIKAYTYLGIAQAYEAKEEYLKAIEEYELIVGKPLCRFLKPEMLKSMARCYEIQGNLAEANRQYDEILGEYQGTAWANEAAERQQANFATLMGEPEAQAEESIPSPFPPEEPPKERPMPTPVTPTASPPPSQPPVATTGAVPPVSDTLTTPPPTPGD